MIQEKVIHRVCIKETLRSSHLKTVFSCFTRESGVFKACPWLTGHLCINATNDSLEIQLRLSRAWCIDIKYRGDLMFM